MSTRTLSKEDELTSEDVYAQTHRDFTRVKVVDLYAFTTLSEDHKTTTELSNGVYHIGIEVEYPTGKNEVVKFTPSNFIQYYPQQSRQEIMNAVCEKDYLWVANHSDVFSHELFPKMWETIVVPTIYDVDAVYDYQEDTFLNTCPRDSLEKVQLGKSTGLLIGAILGGMVVGGSMFGGIGIISGMVLGAIIPYLQIRHENYQQKVYDAPKSINASYVWAKTSDIDMSELEPVTDIDSVVEFLTCLDDGEYNTAEIQNVTELGDTVEMDLVVNGGVFRVSTSQYHGTTSDSILQDLVDSLEVGSVKMLEGDSCRITPNELHANVSGFPIKIIGS